MFLYCAKSDIEILEQQPDSKRYSTEHHRDYKIQMNYSTLPRAHGVNKIVNFSEISLFLAIQTAFINIQL